MGLSATWTITCDHCGSTEVTTLILSDRTYDGVVTAESVDEAGSTSRATTHYNDYWGPGIPDGWIQSVEGVGSAVRLEEERAQYFYCSAECHQANLRLHGLIEEADRYRDAIWMA